jgi:signal transduction histidine kinase/CheY-like chemotaxis protein
MGFDTDRLNHTLRGLRGDTFDHEPMRDSFAVSRMFLVRQFAQEKPAVFSFYLLVVASVWTLLMSYGAQRYGGNQILIQYTPTIGFFVMAIGMMAFARAQLWMPVGVFFIVLLVPFFLPFVEQPKWDALRHQAPWLIAVLFLVNTTAAVLTGMFATFTFYRFRSRLSAYTADLLFVFSAQVAFFISNLAILGGFILFMQYLPADLQALIGFDENYPELGFKRIALGCTVILAFLLVFLHRPKTGQLIYVAVTVALFVILSQFQAYGFGMVSELEAVLLNLTLAALLPQAIAPLAMALGVAIYASLTGMFLDDNIALTKLEVAVDYYAIIGLTIGGYMLAYRGYIGHREETAQDSITRLDAARDFAGVGIFNVNQTRATVQLDPATMRILGVDRVYLPLRDIYRKLTPDSAEQLRSLGEVAPGTHKSLLLHVGADIAQSKIIRVSIWAQRAESGDNIAFGLIVDVTAEHNTEKALRHALLNLEIHDEKQRKIFSIISHEIRTPASVMAMMIEDLTSETAANLQPKLHEASNQLLGVLTDMRQAVNPAENLAINKVPYVPAELGETVRNTYQAQASTRDMQIRLRLGDGADYRRVGDQMRIKQVLGNLVRNSLLYSKGEMVEIAFDAQTDADGVTWSVWTVSDDGIGIDPSDVERLFEPFERGGSDPRSQADGSGLGLYISKIAVELLGGTIVYVPQHKGACYRIAVPEDLALTIAAAPALPPQRKNVSNLRVILVEDNPLVAEVTKARLDRLFGQVNVISNGDDARQAALQTPPDVLITDLFMPKLAGDMLIQQLKAQGHSYPMIGLTAAAVGDDMDRFAAAGADFVMSKPLDSDKLLDFLTGRDLQKLSDTATSS